MPPPLPTLRAAIAIRLSSQHRLNIKFAGLLDSRAGSVFAQLEKTWTENRSRGAWP